MKSLNILTVLLSITTLISGLAFAYLLLEEQNSPLLARFGVIPETQSGAILPEITPIEVVNDSGADLIEAEVPISEEIENEIIEVGSTAGQWTSKPFFDGSTYAAQDVTDIEKFKETKILEVSITNIETSENAVVRLPVYNRVDEEIKITNLTFDQNLYEIIVTIEGTPKFTYSINANTFSLIYIENEKGNQVAISSNGTRIVQAITQTDTDPTTIYEARKLDDNTITTFEIPEPKSKFAPKNNGVMWLNSREILMFPGIDTNTIYKGNSKDGSLEKLTLGAIGKDFYTFPKPGFLNSDESFFYIEYKCFSCSGESINAVIFFDDELLQLDRFIYREENEEIVRVNRWTDRNTIEFFVTIGGYLGPIESRRYTIKLPRNYEIK